MIRITADLPLNLPTSQNAGSSSSLPPGSVLGPVAVATVWPSMTRFAKELDSLISGNERARRDRSLPVVDENLDQVLVNEDAQLHPLASFQLEGRSHIAYLENPVRAVDGDGCSSLADPEHIGARDVLALGHAEMWRVIVMQQGAEVGPGLEVRRLHQGRILTAAESIVGVAIEPAVRVPMTHQRLLSGGVQRVDRHRFGPCFQLVVQGKSQMVPAGALAVIDDSRLAVVGEKARAAEHPMAGEQRSKRGGMPFPAHHVRAGDMGERETVIVSINIVEMVAALPKERAVSVLVVEGPPRPRPNLRSLVGLQRRDLFGGQRQVINARVVNRPGEMRGIILSGVALAETMLRVPKGCGTPIACCE